MPAYATAAETQPFDASQEKYQEMVSFLQGHVRQGGVAIHRVIV